MILQVSDFESGQFQISSDPNTEVELTDYLTDNNEKALIYELMGKDEGDKFIADLSGTPSVPSSPIWTNIFSFFTFEDGETIVSVQGIKEYLKGRVYDQFVSMQPIVNQASGNGRIESDATAIEPLITKGLVLYNRTITEGCKIQYYMSVEASSDYPDFKGLTLLPRSPL